VPSAIVATVHPLALNHYRFAILIAGNRIGQDSRATATIFDYAEIHAEVRIAVPAPFLGDIAVLGRNPHPGINALHCTITELELPSTSLLDTGLLLLEPGKPFVSELVIASGTTGPLELSSQAMNANAATATATPKFLNSKFRRIPYSFFVYGM